MEGVLIFAFVLVLFVGGIFLGGILLVQRLPSYKPTMTKEEKAERDKKAFKMMRIFFICSLILYAYLFMVEFDAKQAIKWPTAAGKVISSELRTEVRRSRTSASSISFADIKYSYTVDDQQFTSTNIYKSDISKKDFLGRLLKGFFGVDQEKVEKLLNKYKKDSEITVYYNPKDISQSLLEPGIVGNKTFLLLMVIGFAMAGFYVLMLAKFGKG